jgi:hypothetical protein
MSTTKLTGRENLTMYAFWLGPGGPLGKAGFGSISKGSGSATLTHSTVIPLFHDF